MVKQDIKKHHRGPCSGFISISLILFFILTVGLLPLVAYIYIVNQYLLVSGIWFYVLLAPLIYIGIVIAVISEILISGFFIWLFRIRYDPGVFAYSFKQSNAFKWILICSLYTPFRKLMEIIPVGGVKNIYYKMLGMKIGENTLVGGVIKDPCVTSFGKNTTMGEYALIYGHITNYQKGTITIKRTRIGDNCVIGAGSILMPGVTVEDDVIVAAGAVVTQDQVLKKGNVYAGIPAKKISKN